PAVPVPIPARLLRRSGGRNAAGREYRAWCAGAGRGRYRYQPEGWAVWSRRGSDGAGNAASAPGLRHAGAPLSAALGPAGLGAAAGYGASDAAHAAGAEPAGGRSPPYWETLR